MYVLFFVFPCRGDVIGKSAGEGPAAVCEGNATHHIRYRLIVISTLGIPGRRCSLILLKHNLGEYSTIKAILKHTNTQ